MRRESKYSNEDLSWVELSGRTQHEEKNGRHSGSPGKLHSGRAVAVAGSAPITGLPWRYSGVDGDWRGRTSAHRDTPHHYYSPGRPSTSLLAPVQSNPPRITRDAIQCDTHLFCPSSFLSWLTFSIAHPRVSSRASRASHASHASHAPHAPSPSSLSSNLIAARTPLLTTDARFETPPAAVASFARRGGCAAARQ